MQAHFDILNYLENITNHINQHGVAIGLYDDDSIFVDCSFPGREKNPFTPLELCAHLKSLDEFTEIFEVTCKKDLDKITPLDLLHLYEQGKVKVYCLIDEIHFGGALYFFKKGATIIAEDDDEECRHEVKKEIKTATDFINYTNTYFLLKSNPASVKIPISSN